MGFYCVTRMTIKIIIKWLEHLNYLFGIFLETIILNDREQYKKYKGETLFLFLKVPSPSNQNK